MRNNPTNNTPAVGGTLPPLRTGAGHYMQALLDAASVAGRISAEQIQSVHRGLNSMLTRLAVTYTFGASGSMPAETAKQLLDSAAYAIGLALKSAPSPDAALDRLLSTPPDDLRREGISVIDSMMHRAQERLKALQAALVTQNRAYLDTINHGLPLFFSAYDKTYAAHESPGSIDYPTCVDISRLTGIEYTDAYIEALTLEAAFLSRDIDALLRGYSPGWRDLLINAYEHAMTNALGCVLCGRDPSRLSLLADDRAYLAERLGGLSETRLRAMLGVALGRLALNEAELAYAQRALPGIAASIRTALGSGHPEAVFVTPTAPPAPTARFIDGPQMDDEAFRALTEAVRECRHASDKLALIRSQVRSLKDLADLLGADVLSGSDFDALFSDLDEVTLRQLAALVPEDAFHASAAEQVWHRALADFLSRHGGSPK
jgi:hypothetical protein